MTTLTAVAFANSPARADVWGITPRASLTTGYDHNLQLSAAEDEGRGGGAASVGARVVRHGDTTNWSLDPQLSLVRYPGQHTLNRDDINVTGALSKYFERAEWASTASFSRDTTISSERGVSGLTESNLPHERIVLSTTPSLRFADLWRASATASWSADDYSATEATGLVNYDYTSLVGQLAYSITERSTLGVDVSFGRLLIPTTQSNTDQYGANVRFDTALTELWRLSIGGGPLRVVAAGVDDPGLGFAAKLQRRSEKSGFELSLSSDTTPDGRGVISRRKQAIVAFNHNLSSRLAADIYAQWMRNRAALPAASFEFEAVNYTGISTALRWQTAPTVSMSFSLGWNRQQQERGGRAESYRAALSISWQGLERGY